MKLKNLVFFFILFSCVCQFFYAQDSSVNSASDDGTNTVQTVTTENPEKKFVIDATDNAALNKKKPSGIGAVIKMILVLIVVVICIYVAMNFMKKSVAGEADTDDPYLRKVAQVTLSPGKTAQIITVLDKCYVVGVADSSVNLIGEITDKELINAMNLSADKAAKTKKARNFADVLSMFLPSQSSHTTEATKTNIYSDSSLNVQDFITNQRKRIDRNKKE